MMEEQRRRQAVNGGPPWLETGQKDFFFLPSTSLPSSSFVLPSLVFQSSFHHSQCPAQSVQARCLRAGVEDPSRLSLKS